MNASIALRPSARPPNPLPVGDARPHRPGRSRSITRRTLLQIPRAAGDRVGALVRLSHSIAGADEHHAAAIRRAIRRSARFHDATLWACTLLPGELRAVVEAPSWALDGLVLEMSVHVLTQSGGGPAWGRDEPLDRLRPDPRVEVLRDPDAWRAALVRATIGA